MLRLMITVFLAFSSGLLFAQSLSLPEKKLLVDHSHIYYYDVTINNAKEPIDTIILLHGLFAKKEQWSGFMDALGKNPQSHFRLLIPDLPGYGKHGRQAPKYLNSVYNIYQQDSTALSQTKVLEDWINLLKLKKFHIAGNSMGGLVAAILAENMPDRVLSLSFIGSPEGVVPPDDLFLQKGLAKGFNPFIPTTKEQFITELQLLLHNYQPLVPDDQKIKAIVQGNIAHYGDMSIIYEIAGRFPFYAALSHPQRKITEPTLIEWGAEDTLFGSPYGEKDNPYLLLYKNLDRSKYRERYIEPDAGHLLLLEGQYVLDNVAEHFVSFTHQADTMNKYRT